MSPETSFVRGVVFAALAAAAWLPWSILVGPAIGVRGALAIYLIGAAALYVASLCATPGRRGVSAALAFTASGAVALLAQTTAELAVGLALVVGVARGLLHPAAPASVLLRETSLLVAGLLFARLLAGPSLVAVALAVWGFLLVQALFHLGGGRRSASPAEGDAFEQARRRALTLLEREPR